MDKAFLQVVLDPGLAGFKFHPIQGIDWPKWWGETFLKWDLVVIGVVQGQFPCNNLIEEGQELVVVSRDYLLQVGGVAGLGYLLAHEGFVYLIRGERENFLLVALNLADKRSGGNHAAGDRRGVPGESFGIGLGGSAVGLDQVDVGQCLEVLDALRLEYQVA